MVQDPDNPFVSRGGLKLAHALEHFNLSVKGLVALDIGASTGGFTDCLLQNACQKVYAVDVGYGQLAWKLRQNPRVVVIERTNFRHWDGHEIQEPINFVTVDVSFISLELILPKVLDILRLPPSQPSPQRERVKIVALIKPNFEVGKGQVGKGGVVRDPALHKAVIVKIKDLACSLGFQLGGVTESPLVGPKGNHEFLILLST